MDICGACESVDDPGGLRVVYDDCSDESVAFPVVDDPVEPKKFEEATRGPAAAASLAATAAGGFRPLGRQVRETL